MPNEMQAYISSYVGYLQNYSLTQFFRSHYDPGVDSGSNRNEYQAFPGDKGGRCVGLTILPSFCADCLEI
jgi:hypothetical protein